MLKGRDSREWWEGGGLYDLFCNIKMTKETQKLELNDYIIIVILLRWTISQFLNVYTV